MLHPFRRLGTTLLIAAGLLLLNLAPAAAQGAYPGNYMSYGGAYSAPRNAYKPLIGNSSGMRMGFGLPSA